MSLKKYLGLSAAVVLVTAVSACSNSSNDNSGTGSTGGATGSGGATGTGGITGSGGNGITGCDTSMCQAGLQEVTTLLGSGASLCCMTTTTCGIDFGALATANALLPKGCASGVLPEAGTLPPPTTVHDGGIIDAPDGGKPILLDKDCTGVAIPPAQPLPGCCMPNGICGSSGYQFSQLGLPPTCSSNDQIKTALGPLGTLVSIPPPKVCTYDVPGQPIVTGHLGDGGEPTPDGGKGTGANDASAPKTDAGKKK
jgi:hypothetical protein